MKYFLLLIFTIIVLSLVGLTLLNNLNSLSPFTAQKNIWEVESVDTMKYSRDLARQYLNNLSFDRVINKQVSDIAATGATHIAIGTPYDEEFRPILKRWVDAARKHKLKVWFRGNWAGWEGWFDYPAIDRPTHIAKTQEFILNNPDLFEDGDIFSSCPECENGGVEVNLNNPQEVIEYRAFLITDYETTKEAFKTIHKNVPANYYSMNGDFAKAIMDKDTTAALDGLVVVDHYVESPVVLADDIRSLAQDSGGNVVLGEFGAPIPDIHGQMTEEEQQQWIEEALTYLAEISELKGLNYWVSVDGSTALWRSDGTPRAAVATLKKFFTAQHE